MQRLIANAPQLEIEELAYDAHKLAKAAGMLGISDISHWLRSAKMLPQWEIGVRQHHNLQKSQP